MTTETKGRPTSRLLEATRPRQGFAAAAGPFAASEGRHDVRRGPGGAARRRLAGGRLPPLLDDLRDLLAPSLVYALAILGLLHLLGLVAVP